MAAEPRSSPPGAGLLTGAWWPARPHPGRRRLHRQPGHRRDRPHHRGNFRLLHRLFVRIGRILRINELTVITSEVIEAARSTSS